jgi:hypothetical protein
MTGSKTPTALRLLGVAHIGLAIVVFAVACMPLAVLAKGIRPAGGWRTIAFWVIVVLWVAGGWTLAGLEVLVARSIVRATDRLFVLTVTGVVALLCVPVGTLVGLTTFWLLLRTPSILHVEERSTQ